MTYGQCMKAARLAKGWTLEKLAAKSGVAKNTISNAENDKHNLSIPLAVALADALGVSLDAYIGHVKCEGRI